MVSVRCPACGHYGTYSSYHPANCSTCGEPVYDPPHDLKYRDTGAGLPTPRAMAVGMTALMAGVVGCLLRLERWEDWVAYLMIVAFGYTSGLTVGMWGVGGSANHNQSEENNRGPDA